MPTLTPGGPRRTPATHFNIFTNESCSGVTRDPPRHPRHSRRGESLSDREGLLGLPHGRLTGPREGPEDEVGRRCSTRRSRLLSLVPKT